MKQSCLLCNKTDEELELWGEGLHVNGFSRGICDIYIDSVIAHRARNAPSVTEIQQEFDQIFEILIFNLEQDVKRIDFSWEPEVYGEAEFKIHFNSRPYYLGESSVLGRTVSRYGRDWEPIIK